MRTRRSLVALVALLTIGAGACSSHSSTPSLGKPTGTTVAAAAVTAAPVTTTPLPPGTSLVATTLPSVKSVTVYYQPSTSAKVRTVLANPNEVGAPLVFLVSKQLTNGWLNVYLPIRPDGAKGWIQSSQVQITSNPYRVVVTRHAHTLEVFQNGPNLVFKAPIGVGTADTPTPGGKFYIKELLQPPNPNGAYGPYAYGLSGFTEVASLANFNGGTGVIGIHGTDEPQLVGTDVSHGCIRLYNADITRLTKILPLGTPVQILA